MLSVCIILYYEHLRISRCALPNNKSHLTEGTSTKSSEHVPLYCDWCPSIQKSNIMTQFTESFLGRNINIFKLIQTRRCNSRWCIHICAVYVVYMCCICAVYVPYMCRICAYMFRICSVYVPYMCRICSVYVPYISCICSVYVPYICRICAYTCRICAVYMLYKDAASVLCYFPPTAVSTATGFNSLSNLSN